MINTKLTTYSKSLVNFFTKGHERSVKTKKNIVGSLFFKGMGITINLALVPLILGYLDPTRYGIWLTLSSIIVWFGFFDIGLGSGLRNKFAEALANDNQKLARVYVSTTYALLIIIFSSTSILYIFINPHINWTHILNTDPNYTIELSLVAITTFILFFIRFIFDLIGMILLADQKAALQSSLNPLASLLILITIFILKTITNTGSLLYVAITFGCAPILVLLITTFRLFQTRYKKYRPSFRYIDFNYSKDLFNIGFKFFIIRIASIVIYASSNIIITQLYNPAEVTTYNVAYKYFSINIMLFTIIITPFWSAITDAFQKKEIFWIKNAINKLIYLWIGSIVISFLMFLVSNKMYELWVGPDILIPLKLSFAMSIFVAVQNWSSIFANFLYGVGKLQIQLYSAIFGIIVNIPLAILLAKYLELGISGIIFSIIILQVISSFLTPIQYFKIINGKDSGIWAK